MKKTHLFLSLIVLLIGIGGASMLALSRKKPQRTERPVLGPLVETIEVQPADNPIMIEGNGEAYARAMTNLVPQVSGRVVEISPNLVGGGKFRAGEVLLKIDPRDFELGVERAEAAVIRAEVKLETQQAEARAAEDEWNALHPGEEPSSALVLRKPQIRQAEAELKAARADLESARLQLERTEISFPFDGIVLEESVDVGQFVTTGKALATIYSTAEIEVRVPLESRELGVFDLPAPGRRGAPATVFAELGGRTLQWKARVSRIEGRIDPSSRMAPVILSVPRAFARDEAPIPLYPGTFVRIRIEGHTLQGSFAVPSAAIRENNTVWIVHGDTLEVRSVSIGRSGKKTAIITGGLEAGEHLVTSLLEAVTDGMTVREEPTGGGQA